MLLEFCLSLVFDTSFCTEKLPLGSTLGVGRINKPLRTNISRDRYKYRTKFSQAVSGAEAFRRACALRRDLEEGDGTAAPVSTYLGVGSCSRPVLFWHHGGVDVLSTDATVADQLLEAYSFFTDYRNLARLKATRRVNREEALAQLSLEYQNCWQLGYVDALGEITLPECIRQATPFICPIIVASLDIDHATTICLPKDL